MPIVLSLVLGTVYHVTALLTIHRTITCVTHYSCSPVLANITSLLHNIESIPFMKSTFSFTVTFPMTVDTKVFLTVLTISSCKEKVTFGTEKISLWQEECRLDPLPVVETYAFRNTTL